jgi:hypothetical protein
MLLQRNLRASKSRVTTGLSYSLTQQRSQATASSFLEWRKASTQPNFNMATPSQIHLTVEDTGIVNFKPQNDETAAKTSELLQENHDVIPTFHPLLHSQPFNTNSYPETSYLLQRIRLPQPYRPPPPHTLWPRSPSLSDRSTIQREC